MIILVFFFFDTQSFIQRIRKKIISAGEYCPMFHAYFRLYVYLMDRSWFMEAT